MTDLTKLGISDDSHLPIVGPSEADIRRYFDEADATLKAQQHDAIPPNTLRALKSAMRYWTYWYRAAVGNQPPLLDEPPAAVPSEDVRLFIAQHSPIREAIDAPRKGGPTHRIRLAMPAEVRERMATWARTAGVELFGRRRMAQRAMPRGLSMDPDMPSLNTIQQRLTMLGALHTLRGLTPPAETDPGLKKSARTLARAVRELDIPIKSSSKTALKPEDLADLLKGCVQPDGSMSLEDIRDRAMILAAFAGGGRRRAEVAAMEMHHVTRANVTVGETVMPGLKWDVYRLKGRRSEEQGKAVLSIPIVGVAAIAIEAWMSELRVAGLTEGPVWRRIYTARSADPDKRVPVIGGALKAEVLAEILHKHAASMFERRGKDPDEAYALAREFGAHSLRSGFATAQLEAGVDPLSVMAMTGHKSLSSFMRYDQRTLDNSPTLALTSVLKL